MNREAWLAALAEQFRPKFEELGNPLPAKIRMSCGFTSSKRAIGECHYPAGSSDETTEIFIHPGQADPIEVGAILVHELAHAALGPGFGHGKVFKKLATGLGLAGPMKATHAGPEAQAMIAAAIEAVGPYPHAKLASGGAADGPRKQNAKKHWNLNCPECGFHAKVLVDQVHLGRLRCPADGELLLHKSEMEE